MCDMEKKPASTGEGRKPTKKRTVKPTKSDNGSTPATGASSQASSSAGSSLTNSRVSTPSIAPSNAASSGSTSAAASCSNSAAALASAELSKPRYQYSRKELLQYRESPHSKVKPEGLSEHMEIADSQWDPDEWISNFAANTGPVDSSINREKRKTPTEGTEHDSAARKRPTGGNSTKSAANNGAACDDDSEDNLILGPQRINNFASGCQVVKRSSNTYEPKRDSTFRNAQSRVGSGRIQITERDQRSDERVDREERRRPERDSEEAGAGRVLYQRATSELYTNRYPSRNGEDSYRTSTYDRDRDRADDNRGGRRDIRDREPRDRDFRDREPDDYDRNHSRDFRDRDNGDVNHGERGLDRRRDRNKMDYYDRRDERRDDDRRGGPKMSNRYPSRGDYSEQSGGMGYRSRDKEPLWFTDGPASQSDTIELRGFEPLSESREQNRRESPRELRDEPAGRVGVGNSTKSQQLGELEVKEKVGKSRENLGKCRSSVEEERLQGSSENLGSDGAKSSENGSERKNRDAPSLSKTTNQPVEINVDGHTAPTAGQFDLNEFFMKSCNQADVAVDYPWLNPTTMLEVSGDSRLSLWRRSPCEDGHNSGPSNSRYVSLFESAISTQNSLPIDTGGLLSMLKKSEQEIPELPSIYMDQRLAPHDQPVVCSNAQGEVAPNVKALMDCFLSQQPGPREVPANVKALMDSAIVSQPVLPSGGKILMAEDLEARMLSPINDSAKNSASQPTDTALEFSTSARRKHPGTGALPEAFSAVDMHRGPPHGAKPSGVLPVGAKVTTLEELEAGLRGMEVGPVNEEKSMSVSEPTNASQPSSDSSAFNKFLELIMEDNGAESQANKTGAASGPESQMLQPPDGSKNQAHTAQQQQQQQLPHPSLMKLFEQLPAASTQHMVPGVGGGVVHPSHPASSHIFGLERLLPNASIPPNQVAMQPPMPFHGNVPLMLNPVASSPMLMHPQMSPSASSPIILSAGLPPTSVWQKRSCDDLSIFLFGTQPPLNITAPMPIHGGQRPPYNLPVNRPVPPQFANPQLPPQLPPSATQDVFRLAYLQRLIQQQQQQQQQIDVQRQREMLHPAERPVVAGQPFMPVNSTVRPGTSAVPNSVGGTNVAKTNVALASIPTSVIRKMAAMKTDEKLPKDADMMAVSGSHPVDAIGTNCRDSALLHVEGMVQQGLQLPPSQQQQMSNELILKDESVVGIGANGAVGPGLGIPLPEPGAISPNYRLQFGQPASNDMSGAAAMDQNRNPRRLVGQGTMNSGIRFPSQPQMMQMDLSLQQQQQLQQLQQQQQQQQQQLQHMQAAPVFNQAMAPPGRPIVKGGQPGPFAFGSGAPPRTNGALTAEQQQHILQSKILQQQQQQQPQQQQAGIPAGMGAGADGFIRSMVAAAGASAPFPQQQSTTPNVPAALFLRQLQKGPPNMMTNQLMPGNVPAARPPPSAGADAIARWFGPDIYGGSRRLPNMPGQRVMTVDEIECSVTAGPPSAAN